MKEDVLEGVTFKMQSKVREQVSHASRRSGKNILGRENCKCEGPEEGNPSREVYRLCNFFKTVITVIAD